MEMPGRNLNPTDYRHGYQGEFTEKDNETGYDAFELRMYDGRMARWMSKDPYRQHHSPYLAMGNNPISGVDPDGGFAGGGGAAAAFSGASKVTSTVTKVGLFAKTVRTGYQFAGTGLTFFKTATVATNFAKALKVVLPVLSGLADARQIPGGPIDLGSENLFGQAVNAFKYMHNNDVRGFVHKDIFKEGTKMDNGPILNWFDSEFGGFKGGETKNYKGEYGVMQLRIFMQDPNVVSSRFKIQKPNKFNGNHIIRLRSKQGTVMGELIFNQKKDYLIYLKRIFGNEGYR